MNVANGLAALVAGCVVSSCQPYRACDPVDEAAVGELPERLSLTGLYERGASGAFAPGVRSFRPRYELWSDGASKQRWILLPPGSTIDTSDQDSWQLPVGTKVWKEFTRDGTRVETRLLQRSASGWAGVAFVWQAGGDDAIAAAYGAIDALGTPHDVPAANECEACHGGRRSHVLGFSAVQLAESTEPDALHLDELARLGLLSDPPAASPRVPGNDIEREALGYLHANCSHCHNADRPHRDGSRCFDPDTDFDFTLRASDGSLVSETRTYRTAQGVIDPGRPDDSALVELTSQRSRFRQMPPLATEQVDAAAVTLLRQWIEAM